MIYYVCKYTPIELFRGFGEECSVLEEMPENFEQSDQIAHANLCGFGKSVIQAVLEGKVEQLVLVNCCDSMRRVYDIVESTGKCKFLYMLDLPRFYQVLYYAGNAHGAVHWCAGRAGQRHFGGYDPGQYPDGCGKSDLYGWSETVGRAG